MRRDQKLAAAGATCLVTAAVLLVVALVLILTSFGPSGSTSDGGYAQRIEAPTITATASGCLYGPQRQADRHCTPGAINPEVTQSTIATTICQPGWTKTVRPPVSYTNTQKSIGMLRYGQPQQPKLYEEDHLIPLELGGSPRNPDNLWPQPWAEPNGANTKDHKFEDVLHDKVCSGQMELAAAQQTIQLEWTH